MNTIQTMQHRLAAYKEEIIFYKNKANEASTESAAARYDAERRYWSGMYDAMYAAIAIIQDSEEGA